MPPAKRRRLTSAKKPMSSVLATRSLFPFAKITKAEVLPTSDRKKRDFGADADSIHIVANNFSNKSRKIEGSKRKLAEAEDGEVNGAFAVGTSSRVSAGQIATRINPIKMNRCLDHSKEQEGAVRGTLRPPSPQLSPKAARSRSPISNLSRRYAQPSPCLSESHGSASRDGHGLLPEALQDLFKLHSSFLTALSLHHAHNGNLAPADLRLLTPIIGHASGRRVTSDDIRRTLGVLEIKPSAGSLRRSEHGLKLSNYGNGKICVEMSDDPDLNLSLDKPIDVDDLNTQFIRNLYGYWKNWSLATGDVSMAGIQETSTNTDAAVPVSRWSITSPESVTKFIQTLPMATINICPSLNKISSSLVKGQMRLEEFKCSVSPTKGKECDEVQVGSSLTTRDHNGVVRRGNNLLERIRAKELHKAALYPPLSQAAVDRRSALQRLDEVISVLVHLSDSGAGLPRTEPGNGSIVGKLRTTVDCPSVLTDLSSVPGKQSISLPLATLVVHLKNSLTNPISREEVEKCVQLLADEVAPHWVNTVTLGQVTAVIIRKGARLEVAGWKSRVGI